MRQRLQDMLDAGELEAFIRAAFQLADREAALRGWLKGVIDEVRALQVSGIRAVMQSVLDRMDELERSSEEGGVTPCHERRLR